MLCVGSSPSSSKSGLAPSSPAQESDSTGASESSAMATLSGSIPEASASSLTLGSLPSEKERLSRSAASLWACSLMLRLTRSAPLSRKYRRTSPSITGTA